MSYREVNNKEHLARALVSDLILLDEPLANLDFKLREELRENYQNYSKIVCCICNN